MLTTSDDLTKRLFIRTIPGYAAGVIDDIFDQVIDGITADLPKYAAAIRAEIPQYWPWLVERSKTSAILLKQIDETCLKSLENDPQNGHALAALINLYLADHPQLSSLYDLATEKFFENVSFEELERIVNGETNS